MPVQQSTLSRMDAILKDRELIDELIKTLNTATPFAEEIRNTIETSGRQAIVPAQFGVNEAFYVRADGGPFGDAKTPQPALAKVKAKLVYGIFEITGPLMSASRDQPGAFVDGLSLAIQNTLDGLKMNLARRYTGRGDSVWALFGSATDADTFVAKNPYGLGTEGGTAGLGDTEYKGDQALSILARPDMAIDILDAAVPTTKHGNNETIASATDLAAGTGTTIEIAPDTYDNVNAAAGDFITGAGDYNLDIEGFLQAVGTSGSYLEITRAGRLGWQGVLTDAAGAAVATPVPLDPNDLRDIVDQIVKVSGHEPVFMVGGYKQRRNIFNISAPQVRHVPFEAELGLNSAQPRDETVKFDRMRFIAERFFPPQHIGFVNPSFWYHVLDKDVEWIESGTGSVLHFLLTSDTFRAVLKTYRNLANLFPATQGILYGLEE